MPRAIEQGIGSVLRPRCKPTDELCRNRARQKLLDVDVGPLQQPRAGEDDLSRACGYDASKTAIAVGAGSVRYAAAFCATPPDLIKER
jgi:hypothetical protein